MSLIATGAIVDPPADAISIQNNGFWPDLVPASFREARRLDGTVTPGRIEFALDAALRDVNRQLAAYQAEQVASGVSAAADIPREDWQVAGHHQDLYRQAIYATAHAWLIEQYGDVAATGTRNDNAGEAKLLTADDCRRDARWAISELLGEGHVIAELI